MTLLEEIFSCYHDDVYRYIFSLCRDASLAEDLTSEVFVEVMRSIGGFRGDSDVKTWLFTIARRRWFRYLKKRKNQPEIADFEELSDYADEDNFERNRLIERIYELISEEQEKPQKVMKMRLDGYSFYEIGNAVKITENSARVLFFRTKGRILKKLKEEGFSYE